MAKLFARVSRKKDGLCDRDAKNFCQNFCQIKKIALSHQLKVPIFPMVRPRGIEPPHPAPEAGALSTELRAHNCLMIIAKFNLLVKTFTLS